MKINVTYPELEELIRTKTGQKVSIRYVRDDVANIVYEFVTKLPIVGEFSKNLSADVKYVGFSGNTLNVQLVDSISIPPALAPLVGRIKNGMMTLGNDNNISVNLDRIDELSKALAAVKINGLSFQADSVAVDLTVK